MQYAKRWMSIDEQIDVLTNVKGLECKEAELRDALTTIGYYRLSAYWFPYKTTAEDGHTVFLEGTSLGKIMRTYEFDRRLRLLMFEATGKAEIYFRSRIAYFAAEENGVFGYPESVTARLSKEYSIAKKSEQYIRHFACKYGDRHDLPPYWVMVECATMGTIELLYSNASPQTRSKIAAELGIKVPVLKNWLSVLRVARNACCHHSRVWNRAWGVKPIIPRDWKGFDAGNDKTFAVLSVLCYILSKIGGLAPWKEKLDELIHEFDEIPLGNVGFPPTWRKAEPWTHFA